MTAIASKQCPICNRRISKRKSEPRSKTERRKTCGRVTCYNTLAARTRTEWWLKNPKPEPAPRTCINCGESFRRKPGQLKYKFKIQKTCSTQCASLRRVNAPRTYHTISIEPEPRICEYCQTPFSRPPDLNITRFNVRKTCSPECAHSIRVKATKVRTTVPPEQFERIAAYRTAGKTVGEIAKLMAMPTSTVFKRLVVLNIPYKRPKRPPPAPRPKRAYVPPAAQPIRIARAAQPSVPPNAKPPQRSVARPRTMPRPISPFAAASDADQIEKWLENNEVTRGPTLHTDTADWRERFP